MRLVKVTGMNAPKIVVPDDCRPLLAASPPFQDLKREAIAIEYFDTPGSAERLIERIRDDTVVIQHPIFLKVKR